MMKIIINVLLITLIVLTSCTNYGDGTGQAATSNADEPVAQADIRETSTTDNNDQPAGNGISAIEQASGQDRYLVVYFFDEDNAHMQTMKDEYDAALAEMGSRAESIIINVNDPSETAIIEKYGVSAAPMPLALVIAPNGAVTGGFSEDFTKDDLLNALVSPSTEKCIKALQESKLVFLCFQNEETSSNNAAMEGVRAFKSDARYTATTEIIMVDPSSSEEVDFLNQLEIEPGIEEAVTVFMAPPGVILTKISGGTDKNTLETALQEASSGGCCPPGTETSPDC